MRGTFLAATLALAALPGLALAQEFDSGWRRIAPGDLVNLELNGGGVRLNNFVVAPAGAQREGETLVNYTFSATALKQVEGRRSVRVELVGVTEERMPTITSSLVFNISAREPNRTSMDQHRFVALPADIAATEAYMVRVVVP
ncbi:hypothetical protein [Falsiroseomonas tokyonensis]|uniref:Uncharacterized protein n=1 Tax=Falsiroseomonas tokyonensis TaxID=430521 RepID=A0ABV7BYL3_9PROT|nr:hypothetical protein [Falsiroseomonas tokyonensis]MBU8540516.1 hypothetical protein [Falsiroseomonas tokyonensis]